MSNKSTGTQQILENTESCLGLRNGTAHLVPLKTTLETTAREAVVNVYITVVPPQKASAALSLAGKLVPKDGGLDLHHLSRFAKYSELPEPIRTSIAVTRTEPSPSLKDSSKFFIVGPTNSITQPELINALSSIIDEVLVYSIPVPLLSPNSQEQATLWTSKYWRTTYNKNHSFGPHPHVLLKAEEEIRKDVGRWMELAASVARETCAEGFGEAVGTVVVERRNGIARPVAVAGDARWLDWPREGSGNVTAHAALRAIAMVADGLRQAEEPEQGMQDGGTEEEEEEEEGIFRDKPVGIIERENCRPSQGEEGYLCHNLEIYCTHEPCVMCSMAIVHSRFGKVVFGQRMRRTGGLCADGDLGHGLFWRKELNWALHAWHWAGDTINPHGSFDGHA